MPAWLKLTLKLLVSACCLWYVSSKIEWQQTFSLLKKANPFYLVAAVIFFAVSKLLSAVRLRNYFQEIGVPVSAEDNVRLYSLGMYYNLFLPGGIGGDAYKVILMNRRWPQGGLRLLSAAVLLDRISGVAGLGILAAMCYALLLPSPVGLLAAAMIIPAIGVFYFIVRKWFPSFTRNFWSALWLGLLVQLAQVFCVVCIIFSIQVFGSLLPYIMLFLLSSVVAVFPFTVGGLGARELVFLWGAQQFSLHQEQAVFVSLIFYFITVVVSLPGLYFVFHSPFQKETA